MEFSKKFSYPDFSILVAPINAFSIFTRFALTKIPAAAPVLRAVTSHVHAAVPESVLFGRARAQTVCQTLHRIVDLRLNANPSLPPRGTFDQSQKQGLVRLLNVLRPFPYFDVFSIFLHSNHAPLELLLELLLSCRQREEKTNKTTNNTFSFPYSRKTRINRISDSSRGQGNAAPYDKTSAAAVTPTVFFFFWGKNNSFRESLTLGACVIRKTLSIFLRNGLAKNKKKQNKKQKKTRAMMMTHDVRPRTKAWLCATAVVFS